MKFHLALSTLFLSALSVHAMPQAEAKGLHARHDLHMRGSPMFRYAKPNGHTRRKTRTCSANLSTNAGNTNTIPESSSQSVAASGGTNEPVITLPSSDPEPTSSQQPAPQPSSQDPAPQPSSQEPAPQSSSQEPAPQPSPSSGGDSGSNSNNSPDVQAYLSQHNNERAAHGANALTWADDLAGVAQSWVNQCIWQHSGGKFGENLSVGTNTSPSGAVQLWLDERDDYNPASPQYSHWTQVVWKGSKEVGCAVASCPAANFFGAKATGTALFYACEYRPAGNVIGQFAQNVQA